MKYIIFIKEISGEVCVCVCVCIKKRRERRVFYLFKYDIYQIIKNYDMFYENIFTSLSKPA